MVIYSCALLTRIVRSYLLHYGYEDTLHSFDMATKSTVPPIYIAQENGFDEHDIVYALSQRKTLREVKSSWLICLWSSRNELVFSWHFKNSWSYWVSTKGAMISIYTCYDPKTHTLKKVLMWSDTYCICMASTKLFL